MKFRNSILLIVALCTGHISFGQADFCREVLQPYIFNASSSQEITDHINTITAFSKSSNKEFNQELKGRLIIPNDGIFTAVGINTRFDSKNNFSENDYAGISKFCSINLDEKRSYYFIPEIAIDAWNQCKDKVLNGNIWTDINATVDKNGYNISYSIFLPEKDSLGSSRKSNYNISKIWVNKKEIIPADGKTTGVIKAGSVYTGTLQVKTDSVNIQIDIEKNDKPVKLIYVDKNKGSQPEKNKIPEYYISELPGASIANAADVYQIGKENVFPLRKTTKYKAMISFTVTNGSECAMKPGDFFHVRPNVKELTAGITVPLEERSFQHEGKLIYTYLYDIPAGTSFVIFNLSISIACVNGGTKNNGHVSSGTIMVFQSN